MRLLPLLLGAALWASGQALAFEPGAYPLLDLARELEKDRLTQPRGSTPPKPQQFEHALEQAQPPGDAECAHSLGARAFAGMYARLARARAASGDLRGAAEAYRHAQACRPRNVELLRGLAEVLFDSRDFEGARAAANQALAIDAQDLFTRRLLGNIEFVAENWAEAMSAFRFVASGDPDRNRAGYGQLMFWLTQKRAGVPQPEFVGRRPGRGWPVPMIDYLKGRISEAELVTQVREGDNDYEAEPHTSTEERLCEALYYVGQAHWAKGDLTAARAYFAALVNLRVTYFVEHGLALAEIAKLNQQNASR